MERKTGLEPATFVCLDTRPRWRRTYDRWTNLSWASIVHELLSEERSGGGNRPPAEWIKTCWQERYGPEYVAAMTNDGFELSIGFPDKWLVQIRHRSMLRLAFWYIVRVWAIGTWFGLKRWLWYKALHAVVNSYKKNSGPTLPATGESSEEKESARTGRHAG